MIKYRLSKSKNKIPTPAHYISSDFICPERVVNNNFQYSKHTYFDSYRTECSLYK